MYEEYEAQQKQLGTSKKKQLLHHNTLHATLYTEYLLTFGDFGMVVDVVQRPLQRQAHQLVLAPRELLPRLLCEDSVQRIMVERTVLPRRIVNDYFEQKNQNQAFIVRASQVKT